MEAVEEFAFLGFGFIPLLTFSTDFGF